MTPFISSRVRKLDVGISGYTDSDSVLNVTGKVSIGTEIDIVPYDTVNNGTLRLEGSAGTLFSISNNLTSGSIFSVNDVSGIPSFDVNADGTVLLAPFGSTEYVGIGTNSPAYKLDIIGDVNISASNAYKIGTGSVVYYSGGVTKFSDLGGGLSLDTDNTERLFIDTSGKVGIGTTSPGAFTHIKASNSGAAASGTLVVEQGSAPSIQILSANSQTQGILFGDPEDNDVGRIQYSHPENSLRFFTNSGERARITSTGLVGIGTTSPGANLDISSSSNTTTRINCGASDASILEFTQSASRKALIRRLNGGELDIINEFGDLRFWTASDGNELERLRITSAGRVGIGTSNPQALLHLAGLNTGAGSSNTIRVTDTDTAVVTDQICGRIEFETADTGNPGVNCQIDALYSGSGGGSKLQFRTGFAGSLVDALHISDTGNVGIGTSSPGANLELGAVASANQSLKINSAGNNYLELSTTGATGEHKIAAGNSASGTAQLIFETSSGGVESERARIDSSGRVGIGSNAPQALLHCETSSGEVIRANSTNANGGFIAVQSSGTNVIYVGSGAALSTGSSTDGTIRVNTNLTFATGATERARIDSSGRLLVGTSGTRAIEPYRNTTAGIVSQVLFENANAALTIVSTDNSNSAYGASLYLARTRGSANQPVVSGDALGGISFAGGDNTDIRTRGASIDCEVDGTPGANDMPGRLIFSTTADGAATPTERLRITSAGQIQSNGLGSAASPALSFTTDTNTGIYSPGADQLAISTGGTGRLFVDANGNVGLSTNTPDVFGRFYTRNIGLSSSGSTALQINAAAGSNAVIDVGVNSVRTAGFTSNTTETIITTLGATPLLVGTNSLERLRITSAGLVGIGTSSPSNTAGFSQQVEIAGTFPCLTLNQNNAGFTTRKYSLAVNASGDFGVWDNTVSAYRMYINNSGNVGIGTNSPTARFHVYDAVSSVVGNFVSGASSCILKLSDVNTTDQVQIYSSGNDLTFRTDLGNYTWRTNNGASEAMRITSAGFVGIGTTSPQSLLHLNTDGTALRIQRGSAIGYLYHTGTSQTDIFRLNSEFGPIELLVRTGQDIRFSNSNSEFARIDSSGRLLVGTSSARSNFFNGSFAPKVQYEGYGSANASFSIVCNNTSNADSAFIALAKSSTANVGDNGVVANDEALGGIFFLGNDGAEFVDAARITCETDGTPGTNDMPGRLVFSTTADGSASPTERMRITSDGQIQANSLGSAAAPVLSFTTDTNTGIYSPGANQLAISTGGTGRLFVDASGNVGIGTQSPSTNLELSRAGNNPHGLSLNAIDVTNSPRLFFVSTSTNNAPCLFGNDGNLVIHTGAIPGSSSGSERVRIDSSGNVGIGTSSPDAVLDVRSGASGFSQFVHASGQGGIRIAGTGPGSSANLVFSNNQGSGISDEFTIQMDGATDDLLFISGGTGGTERVRITEEGRLGIGTTAPSAKLEVAGDQKLGITGGENLLYIARPSDGAFSGRFGFATSDSTRLFINNSGGGGVLAFETQSTERARIDSSGRLLVGTSSGSGNAKIQLEGGTIYGDAYLDLCFRDAVASGQTLGELRFTDAAASANVYAKVAANADGTPGAGSYPGRLVFYTTADGASSPTERMRITSAGNVGIGTDSPQAIITSKPSSVFSTSTSDFNGEGLFLDGTNATAGNGLYGAGITWSRNGAAGTKNAAIASVQTGADSDLGGLAFFTHQSTTNTDPLVEALRIDSSGRLLVGTSSASAAGTLTPRLQVQGTDAATSLLIQRDIASDAPPYIVLAKTRAGAGNVGLVVNNDSLGRLVFAGGDGVDVASVGAEIGAFVDGTSSANDLPTRLVFSTTPDGSSGPTERMRIQSNGAVLIGNATDLGAGLLQVNDAPGRWALTTQANNISGGNYLHWNLKVGGSNVGAVTSTTTTTTYGTASDYRLKESIKPITDGITRLNRLKPIRFNFIKDPDKTVDGFLAHEAQAVVPESVVGLKDELDDKGKPVYQNIDQSKLVPLLTAALQEALERIEVLEAKVNALEGN